MLPFDRKEDFIFFHRPSFDENEKKELIDTLDSGWLTTGPKVKKFESLFAEFKDVKHAIGVNSCTAGLHLALVALGIGPGDEVITSPMTFAATANVIVHTGATPVFVDVQEDTLNLDPQKLERAITQKTKAIMPVHFAGHPCDMDEINEIATSNNLSVIEDAAHAVESEYKNRKVGCLGNVAAFSFYATKNITTGEGGMVTTDNDELSEKIRILSLHGISKDAWKRYSNEGYQHWDIIYPGFKYNMTDIQAALGIHQLAKLNNFHKERKGLVEKYDSAFKDIPGIKLLSRKSNIKHGYHIYVIQVRSEFLNRSRDIIMNELQENYNIGIGIHFRAVHLHPYYSQTFGFKKGDFPVAEYASERVISLPLYPGLRNEDIDYIIRVIRKIAARNYC